MNRVRLAALNNAHLYQRVCAAHGCRTTIDDAMLLCIDEPPRFFGRAVTLAPGVGVELLRRIDGPFKDSFHDVEPDSSRYNELFEAEWIWREPNDAPPPILLWSRVGAPDELRAWERGWAYRDPEAANFSPQFHESLLTAPDVAFFATWDDDRVLGGAMFNASHGVVGVSNVFSVGIEEPVLWSEVVAVATAEYMGVPLSGYERGDSLSAAMRAGFDPIGALRVFGRV